MNRVYKLISATIILQSLRKTSLCIKICFSWPEVDWGITVSSSLYFHSLASDVIKVVPIGLSANTSVMSVTGPLVWQYRLSILPRDVTIPLYYLLKLLDCNSSESWQLLQYWNTIHVLFCVFASFWLHELRWDYELTCCFQCLLPGWRRRTNSLLGFCHCSDIEIGMEILEDKAGSKNDHARKC